MRNDYEIQQDVMTELNWQPFLTAANIGVAVKNGVVTLSGSVDTFSQKQAAERAAKKVLGVRAIAEDIQIGVSPVYNKSDTDIAQSVASALQWHSSVPNDKLKVKVEDGTVTLEGEVDWDFQRTAAVDAVSHLLGVRDVINITTVRPRVHASDISAKIRAALYRSAITDAGKIKVEVEGSTVKLKGAVRSFVEKEDAEEAAWCAPGVSRVENNLYVEPQFELTM
jgi:osmotically-inducible protein OsmY